MDCFTSISSTFCLYYSHPFLAEARRGCITHPQMRCAGAEPPCQRIAHVSADGVHTFEASQDREGPEPISVTPYDA